MNTRVKKLWVDALRAGKIKHGGKTVKLEQARQALHPKSGGYCCLGVLCELFRLDTGQGYWSGPSDALEFEVNGYSESQALPPPVIAWADVLDFNPDTLERTNRRTLAELNDDGYSFQKIADVIERDM